MFSEVNTSWVEDFRVAAVGRLQMEVKLEKHPQWCCSIDLVSGGGGGPPGGGGGPDPSGGDRIRDKHWAPKVCFLASYLQILSTFTSPSLTTSSRSTSR